MVVHKYTIDRQAISFSAELIKGSKILSLKMQRNEAVLYVLVPIRSDQQTEQKDFIYAETGPNYSERALEGATYIGTALYDGDTFVKHLFEII